MGLRSVLARAAQGIGQGISGAGYRLGVGSLITEMSVPPGWSYESYLRVYGQVGWLFGAVSLIAESVAEVPWTLYRTDRGEREEIDDHPLIDLMHRVNRFQTWYQFCQLLQMYIGLVGEAFIVLNTQRIGGVVVPTEMWLAEPQYMVVRPDPKLYISHYEYRRGTNILPLAVEEVIHIMSPDPSNPYRGLGASRSIGVDLDSERYASRYQNRLFYNDATPGMLIEFPSLPPKPQREQLREEWDEIHRGWRNARKTGFLWGGAKASTLTMTNRDMDFWRLRKFNRETILGAFRIPTSLMGLAEVGSRARAEADEYIFSKRVIRPALTRIRESLNEQLCILFDPRLVLDYDDPVPENREALVAECDTLLKNGTITREESREKLGWERDAEKGDTFLIPANIITTPVKAPGQTHLLKLPSPLTRALSDEQKDTRWKVFAARTAAQERMFINMLASLWNDQLETILKGIERGLRDDFLDELVEIDKFVEAFNPIIYEVFVTGFEETIEEIEGSKAVKNKQAGIIDQAGLEWIASRSLLMSKSINQTTIAQVRAQLAEGFSEGESIPQLSKRIKGYFKNGLEHRAPMTARTETIAASNEGALQGYEDLNVERVEFFASPGACEICLPLHEEEFATRDSHGKIPLHPNCRCTWIPVID